MKMAAGKLNIERGERGGLWGLVIIFGSEAVICIPPHSLFIASLGIMLSLGHSNWPSTIENT